MVEWYVKPERSSATERKRAALQVRHDGQHANSLALIITVSLLFVLLASALLVGGQVAIGPLSRRGDDARDSVRRADLVYPMPDGVFCRHMSFDNATGAISEGNLVPCGERSAGARDAWAFKWIAR